MSPLPLILLASASPRRHEILVQLGIHHAVLRVPTPPGEDEPVLPGELAGNYVRRTARDKAKRAVQWLLHDDPQPDVSAMTPDTAIVQPGTSVMTPDAPVMKPDTLVIESRTTPGDMIQPDGRATRQSLPLQWRQAPILCADTTVILDDEILGKPADRDAAIEMLQRLSGRTHTVHTAVVVACDGQLFEASSISQVTMATITDTDITHYCDSSEPFGKAGSYAIQGRAAAFISHLSGSYSGVMGLPAYETCQLLRRCASRTSIGRA